jgi:division protein CdvB (Snf7/Vps24/ESCRT-III family)
LSKNFTNDWAREKKVPMSKSIADTIHPVPLRDRITKTIYSLNMVQHKLENSRLNIEQKHKALFSKCVHAQENKETQTAVMYANECAQVKKIAQTIVTSQLALEQVVLRLETVEDFGDVAAEIMPAAAVIRSVKGRLAGVIPEVSMSLGTISQTLDSLVLEVGEATGQSWNVLAAGEDADKVLAEATMIAEQKVREGFPELPTASTAEKGVNQP